VLIQVNDIDEPKVVGSGSFAGEISSIYFFNPLDDEWQWEGHDAPEFPTGYLCGLSCYGTNLSDTTETLGIKITIIDPDGTVINSEHHGYPGTPKWYGHAASLCATCHIPGDYTGVCQLYICGELVDSIVRTIAHVTSEYEGTITGKEFRHNSSQDDIPAIAEIGEEGIVYMWGRNDMPTNQKMGIEWDVHDPDGHLVQTWDQWETWHTGPGLEQGFMGPTFPISKEGNYHIDVRLKMNYDNPEFVNEWSGVLCTVASQEYEGTITEKTLRYNSHEDPIPVSGVPTNYYEGLIIVYGSNDTDENQKMGIHWVVKDPDGLVIVNGEYTRWENSWTQPGHIQGFEDFGGAFSLDKEGSYTIVIELLMNKADPVIVDSYSGLLCTVTPGIPPEYQLIQHTIYPFAYIYDGQVKTTTVDLTIDAFTPSGWYGGRYAKSLEEEARAEGKRILETRVYADVSALLWTKLRIEVTETYEATEARPRDVGNPGGWLAIIFETLLIIGVLVALIVLAKTIISGFHHYPGLHEIKPTWSKETLIMTIKDSEEYWERVPTPEDTLEAMSEGELRDHLDQVAEEELGNGGISVWWWVAGGAVGALTLLVIAKGAVK